MNCNEEWHFWKEMAINPRMGIADAKG